MRIFAHECRKAIASPVLIGLLIVFIAYNLFIILGSSAHKEELYTINGIIDQYGLDITASSLDDFEQDIQDDLAKLSASAGQDIDSIHAFLDGLPFEEKQNYLKDPAVSQLLVKTLYLERAKSIDEDYASIDLVALTEKDVAMYGLSGKAADLYRREAEKFNVRFDEMVEAGEHKQWFFPGKQYFMHDFLYKKVFLNLIIESLLLVVLSTGLITTFEFEHKTHLVAYHSTRGRRLKRDKLLASLIISTALFVILFGITLSVYFTVFDYSHVWNTSVSSAFNWEFNFPYVSWWHLSIGQFLIGTLLLVFITQLLFSGLTFAVAVFVKNSYIAFFVIATFFILLWLLPSFMPKSSILLFITAYTLPTLVMAISSSFMGSSGLIFFENFEWLTISAWTILTVAVCYLSYHRFLRTDL